LLLEKEELLQEGCSEIAHISGEVGEKARAKKWLKDYEESSLLLRAEWERIEGVEDSRKISEMLLSAALIRFKLGMKERARRLLLLAREIGRWNSEIHKAILKVFQGVEFTFDRIHSLEALVRLMPDDLEVSKARQLEYLNIGCTPPKD